MKTVMIEMLKSEVMKKTDLEAVQEKKGNYMIHN